MEQTTNLLKQNRTKIFLLIIIIGSIILISAVLLGGNKNNSLNAGIQRSCKIMCVYNINKATWDFHKQSVNQNINQSFPTKDGCLRFCFIFTMSTTQHNP